MGYRGPRKTGSRGPEHLKSWKRPWKCPQTWGRCPEPANLKAVAEGGSGISETGPTTINKPPTSVSSPGTRADSQLATLGLALGRSLGTESGMGTTKKSSTMVNTLPTVARLPIGRAGSGSAKTNPKIVRDSGSPGTTKTSLTLTTALSKAVGSQETGAGSY